MSVRSVVAIVFYVVGLILLVYAGWNFNDLFFIKKLMEKPDIPTYSQMVFTPVLVALLILLDGAFIANLKRVSSGVLYGVGNLVWLYGFYLLTQKLSIPVNDIDAYRTVFYLISAGVLVFVVGTIVNDLPKRKK